MAFLRTTVTGNVFLPDGSVMPDGANIIFTLRSWDKDADLNAVALPGPVIATVEDGAISVDLIRTASTDGQVTYDVGYIYRNPWTQLPVPGRLGVIAISGAADVDIDDLLPIPAPVPDVPDALAQALAAAADAMDAAASANAAAYMALVGTGTGFDSVQQMVDSAIGYGANSLTHNGETVDLTVEAGDRWRAAGYEYQVLEAGASNYDLITIGGGNVKLQLMPSTSGYDLAGVQGATAGQTVIQAIISRGLDVRFPNGVYYVLGLTTAGTGQTVKLEEGVTLALAVAGKLISVGAGDRVVGDAGSILNCNGLNTGQTAVDLVGKGSELIGIEIKNSAHSSVTIRDGAAVRRVKVTTPTGIDKYAIYDVGGGDSLVEECLVDGQSGDGIFFNGTFTAGAGVKRAINNIVRNITHSTGTGEFGNGIHAYQTGAFISSGNYVEDTSYTSIRCASSRRSVISNNICRDPGGDSVAIYSEFAHQDTIVSGNLTIGGGISVPNQETNDGKTAVISDNTVVNGYVFCEAHAAIANLAFRFNDTEPQAPNNYDHVLTLGFGNTCRLLSVSGVTLKDERASPNFKAVVGVLAQNGGNKNAGLRYGVTISGVNGRDSNGRIEPVAGHINRVVVPASGWVEPVPAYVNFLDLARGNAIGATGASATSFLVGKFPMAANRPTFYGGASGTASVVKFLVEVFGDRVDSTADGIAEYLVSATSNTNKNVRRMDRGSTLANHSLKIYQDGTNYYIVVTMGSSYGTSIRSRRLAGVASGMRGQHSGEVEFICEYVDGAILAGWTDDTANWTFA